MTAANARKLFGTDGIRAVAGEPPLDPTTIFATGLALGHSLPRLAADRRVLLGRDTRESSPWIAATLAAGLRTAGVAVESAGIIPTPGVAYLTHTHGYGAGVVISASHNPWRDNGIKLFGSDGYKLPDAVELGIEDEIVRHANLATPPDPASLPQIDDNLALREDYIRFLRDSVPDLLLGNLSIVADCANGAAAAVAPDLFARLGGVGAPGPSHLGTREGSPREGVTLLNIQPDGRNINAGCGALHPEWVAHEVKARGAHIGVTFDGDADRCMLSDSQGQVINGDAILLMAARDLKARGMLTGDIVVATTMSNMGLEAALKRSGIRMLRAGVGDRYVLEMMLAKNAALGGEQSGHILFPHLATTGDGLLTALVVLDLVARSGKSLDELCADLKVFPQTIVNVHVREKKPLQSIPAVQARIHEAENDLRESGRVVIRYSGTERLARVMIEAEDEAAMQRHANAIADAIRAELGA
ncbi:MAG TPA: phosphoglucosamine mutase [Terracidiphilus sp.]|jgi:phosphoglucosamine mutase|nr:phosphoglucosamine mutase [Terracidiphilus sp.]